MLTSVFLFALAAVADQPRALISDKDYPIDARNKREEGVVHTRLVIGADGRVKVCEIIATSGSRSLDHRTCEIMRKRARFTPAMDNRGKPIESTLTPPPIAWRL